MDNVSKDIKEGKIANLYLFYGEDAYKRRVYKNLLKKTLFSNDMNYSYFEGDSISWEKVYDCAASVPFFAERRLVIIENCGKFKARSSGGEDKSGDEYLLKIFEDIPPATCLAFFEEDAAKNKKIFKEINKKGTVAECTHDSEAAVGAWLRKGFRQAGKNISDDNIRFLIERTGTDYESLKTEYDKIVAYAGDSDTVTRADIEAVTNEDVEAKVFDMLNACGDKNPALMLEKYYGMLANDIHPLIILSNIRSQFRSMLQVAELCNKGLSDSQVAKQMGKPDFVIRKNKNLLRNFRRKAIEDLLDEMADMDKRIKDGDMDERTGVEILLVEAAK